MKKYIDIWDKRKDKNFSIINYKIPWKMYNNKPQLSFDTNGDSEKHRGKCLDVTLTIGYIVINYTNFNL